MTNPFTRVAPVFFDIFKIEQVPAHFGDDISWALAHIDFWKRRRCVNKSISLAKNCVGQITQGSHLKQSQASSGFFCQARFNHFHRPIETKAIGRPKCLPPEASEIIRKIIANHFER
jgi:hypothetical protein